MIKKIQIYDWYYANKEIESIGLKHNQEINYSESRVLRIVSKLLSTGVNVAIFQRKDGDTISICASRARFGQY